MRRTRQWVGIALIALLLASCGDDRRAGGGETPATTEPTAAVSEPIGPLLEESGTLDPADMIDARGHYDRYFVQVAADDRIVVTLTSSAFDPILEVTPPASGMLTNDDYQGDTSRSQIELISNNSGQMKIEVRSYTDAGVGAYQLVARRVSDQGDATSVPVLSAGQSVDGDLGEGDQALSSGDRFDSYVVRSEAPIRIQVSARGGAAPRSSLVGPDGLAMEGREGVFDELRAGTYRLQVIGASGLGYRVQVTEGRQQSQPLLTRAHHQFNQVLSQLGGSAATPNAPRPANPPPPDQPGTPTAQPSPLARALPVRIGDRLNGNLSTTDARLPSGEYFDVYELEVRQPGEAIAIEMESAGVDCFLRVDGPGGGHWENDDFGGTLNSRVEVPLENAGTYRVVTTSYRAGETGPYQLKVLTQRDAQASGQPASPSGSEQTIAGSLAQGDSTLRSGEFADEHPFEWTAGTRIHLEARSTQFDTYLIVHPPSGPQRDNDDMTPGQGLNAGMDLQVGESGRWRVVVTSYQPGETGDYTLVVGGGGPSGAPPVVAPPGPGPAPPAAIPGGQTQTGNLAQGDRTLQSGEFVDVYPMTFTARNAVQIRLESSAFDTYLIVRSPSGHQDDNDDLTPGQGLNSGLDIQVAEPGTYQISVTSYRPGETGSYTLRVSEGASVVSDPVPTTPTTPNAPNALPSPGAGRVWGLFAGITDYPGSVNDLPECANDARKLARAVREQGNMPADQEFLLTDSQATTGAIRQAMQTIASRIRPDDVFVFFYSGHGGQTDSSQDTRELDRRDEYMLVYDGQLMDDDVGRLFDAIHARIALVAIDACFAGGFAKDVITQPGRVGMFSSEEDVTSAVAGNFQAGGYLSHFLRLGIQGEADSDPRNSILTVGELTHYTWRQFGQHASDVRMSMGYQHLVVDRGAVPTTDVLWAVRR